MPFAFVASLACGEGLDDAVMLRAPVDAHARPYIDAAPERLFVAGSGAAAFQSAEGIDLFDRGGRVALPRLSGVLVGLADVGAGRLVATTEGAFLIEDGASSTVQIFDEPRMGTLVALHEAGGGVWAVATRGVALVVGSTVRSFLPRPAWSSPPRSAAPSPDGAELWVVVDDRLHVATLEGERLGWTRFDAPAEAVGVGADGHPIVLDRGEVSVLVGDRFRSSPLEARGAAIASHPRGAVWIRTPEGLARWDGAAWTPVVGVDGDFVLQGATPEGGAVGSRADRTEVAYAGPSVGLFGELGAVLREPVALEPWVTRPESVDRIELHLDGRPVPPSSDGLYRLDPNQLGFGERQLRITAHAAGEVYAESERRFRSEPSDPPTWAGDIEPLFLEKCALCHGAGAAARPLASREDWVDAIDTIIANVSTGRMPLPPIELLDPSEVAQVETWRDAEFPQ